ARPLTGALEMGAAASLWASADARRHDGRRRLLDRVNRAAAALQATAGTRNLDECTQKAYDLLASRACRDAFDLAREPQKVRDFYGPTPFAQSCLLARRLVEAGVPLVTVYSASNRDWDTHSGNFQALKDTLLPPTDRGLSALLTDLDGRGLLD